MISESVIFIRNSHLTVSNTDNGSVSNGSNSGLFMINQHEIIIILTTQVVVKVEAASAIITVSPPAPADSVGDTMYFIDMMKQEREERRRRERDELINRMAREQKLKKEASKTCQTIRI